MKAQNYEASSRISHGTIQPIKSKKELTYSSYEFLESNESILLVGAQYYLEELSVSNSSPRYENWEMLEMHIYEFERKVREE